MKRDFFDYLIQLMAENKDIYFVCPDLGYPRTDEIKQKFPDRYIWTGAAEQVASDICVGLSYSGKIPVMYTITPFFYRCFETIRNYFSHESLHVILIGAGRNDEYSRNHGFSHFAGDDKNLPRWFRNISFNWPKDTKEMKEILDMAIKNRDHATYINLKR